MTNEQAIDILEHARLMSGFPEQIQFSFDAEGKEALKMAIKALEQQTSEDCISREAVIKHICESKECYKDECKGRLYKRCYDLQWIYALPSVTPKPKVGKWIRRPDRASDIEYRCSECGKIQFADDTNELNYCCNCGSKMEVSE